MVLHLLMSKILWGNTFERSKTTMGRVVFRACIVDGERLIIVHGKEFAGHVLQEAGFKASGPVGQVNDMPMQPLKLDHIRSQFVEGVFSGATQIDFRPPHGAVEYCANERVHHIPHINGLKTGLPAGKWENQGYGLDHPGKILQEIATGAEDERRPHTGYSQCGPTRGVCQGLGLGLAAQITAITGDVFCPQGAHVEEVADTLPLAGMNNLPGQFNMDVLKSVLTTIPLVEDPYQINHYLTAIKEFHQVIRIVQISLKQLYAINKLQITVPVWITAGNAKLAPA